MSDKTKIEWTEATWNPTTGCDRVSPGCDNCYALNLAPRLKAMGSARYQRDGNPATSGPGFGLTLHSDTVGQPMRWTKPRLIFVNSMSDLFHNEVPDRFIADVFAVMSIADQHTYQALTKRHGRMRSLLNSPDFWYAVDAARRVRGYGPIGEDGQRALPNVWLGVSVEDQKRADLRIPALLDTPAAVRWLSMEPLLGPVDLRAVPGLDGQWGHDGRHHGSGATDCPRSLHHHHDDRCRFPIDWVVVGGESGRSARPMEPDWARGLRGQCVAAGVPYFFKQWGEWLTVRTPSGEHRERVGKKLAGRELDGRTWDAYPARVTP